MEAFEGKELEGIPQWELQEHNQKTISEYFA
jgi:hypothetical protein